MPSGPRIRDNNIFGTTTDNPLTAGAGTFNSAGLANLEVVATAHAIVTLDPLREFGEPEIVIITAHTAAATVATITRAAYGTVARAHPLGTLWVHTAVDEDYIEILTSATRPSDPFEGQFIYETDTKKLVGYGGVDWAPRDAGGVIGYAEKTATDQSGITAITDLTGLSTTVTVGTGRRIFITAFVPVRQITNEALVNLSIREGATTLGKGWFPTSIVVSGFMALTAQVSLTPTAGSHTYKLSLDSTAASVGTVYGTDNKAFILVEDIGAA